MTPETCQVCNFRQLIPAEWGAFRCRRCGERNRVLSAGPALRVVPEGQQRPHRTGGAHRRRPSSSSSRPAGVRYHLARYKAWSAPLVVMLVAGGIGAAGWRLPGARIHATPVSSSQAAGANSTGGSVGGVVAVSQPQAGEYPVPDVTQLKLAAAVTAMRRAGLDVEVSYLLTANAPPGVVVYQGVPPSATTGDGHVVHLVVSGKAPTTPHPAPVPTPPPTRRCDPNYVGQCLNPSASDYDCAGQVGNGPLWVWGEVRVVGRDHFDLDRNDDGIGCN